MDTLYALVLFVLYCSAAAALAGLVWSAGHDNQIGWAVACTVALSIYLMTAITFGYYADTLCHVQPSDHLPAEVRP